MLDLFSIAGRNAYSAIVGGATDEKSVTSGVLLPKYGYTGRSMFRPWTKWTTSRAIKDGYYASEWVKICVDRVARPAASVPWKVSRFKDATEKRKFVAELKSIPAQDRADFIRTKDDTLEPEPDHPLQTLMEEPNPFFDRASTIERLTQHLLLGGNACLTKVRFPKANGPVIQLWIIEPDRVEPIPDREKFLTRYEISQQGEEPIAIKPQDMIHFMLPDPENLYWGTSVLRSGAKTIDSDVEAVSWQKQSFENRAVPDGILALEQEIDPEEFDIMRQQLSVQYEGSSNARRMMLVGNEAKYYPMSRSPVEMDFITSRKMNRQAICALFDVSMAIAGANEQAPSKDDRRDHWVSVIIPYLDRVQGVLNRSLAREFGDDVFLWYDTINVDALQENFHEKVRSSTLLTRQGLPFAAVNRRLRMQFKEEEVKDLKIGFLPASTRAVPEILRSLEEPDVDEEGTNPNSPQDGGEQIEDEPENDVDDGDGEPENGDDAEKARKLEEKVRRQRLKWRKESEKRSRRKEKTDDQQ